MPLRNLTVIFLTAILSLACYQKAQRYRYTSVLGEAMRLVDLYYLEKVDRRALFEQAMSGMVESLDQYSSYIGPDYFKEMEESLDQEFGGIGIEVEKEAKDQPLVVLSPIVDTPAYRVGMRAGDAILGIDGESTIGMELKEAVQCMRGRPGTEVNLRIRHANAEDELELTVTREVIVVDSVLGDVRNPDGSWDFRLVENQRIGYLRVTTFGKHTAEELTRVLQTRTDDPYPFDGLILDLRGNAGGLLDAAVEVCDLFIDQGTIVKTSGRDGETRSSYSANPLVKVPSQVPIAVVVNKYSASASEIVAACLQDHQRAAVVGSRTWGKGTVQNIFELEGGRSALKLTTAGYMRPSGQNIHKRQDATDEEDWGVRPNTGFDVEVPEEEAQNVFIQRRRRDVLAPPARQPGEKAVDQDGTPENDQGPVEDRQLRRAIEYVEQKLGRHDARKLAA